MKIVDTNIVLRYVLGDDEKLSAQARDIIENNKVEIPIEVLCEAVYVLSSVYKAERSEIETELRGFFEKTHCALPHRESVLKGLELFGNTSLDFVDCILAGYKIAEGFDIYTLDNKLKKLL